jgi:hypothetical protein
MATTGSQEGYAVPPAITPPRSRRTGGASFDMTAFVNRVADQYQEEHRIVVDRSARATLIAPALPHAHTVAEALSRREISMQFLEECVLSLLRRAHRIATERGLTQINDACAQESMDEECPYLGWC